MIMKSRIQNIVVLAFFLLALSGCGVLQDNKDVISDVAVQETDVEESTQETDEEDDIIPEVLETDIVEDTAVDELEPEELLDAFLAGEIPAIYDDESERVIMYDQLPHDEDDWENYSVGERIDLDNDGEVEQIVNGPYGGIYFDARDGKVYVLAEGDGTAIVLSYADYDNATWIVHSDTTHGGRQLFWLMKYDGEGKIVDEFGLGAEYWDSADFEYHEDSDFTYRDEKISMSEYEELRKEIFGW